MADSDFLAFFSPDSDFYKTCKVLAEIYKYIPFGIRETLFAFKRSVTRTGSFSCGVNTVG